MKKFLVTLLAAFALPTTVDAFPWANKDIIVKTDLDEQYIVKDSAVTALNFGKDEILKEIDESQERNTKDLQACVDGPLSYNDCAGIYEPEKRKQRAISRKNTINLEEQNVHFVGVRFRPIFVDLNNQKSALDYDKVGCINPKINKETLEIWDWFTGIQKFKGRKKLDAYNAVDTNSSLAYEKMRAMICDKYAKF